MRRPADPRVSALRRFAVSITVLTIVGHLWLGIEQSWAQAVVAVATSHVLTLLLESVEAWAQRRRPQFAGGAHAFITFLLPAHISGMAISLLLYPSDRLWPFAFAAAVAVAGKYLFRAPVNGRMRHVMNPSNLGIATTLVVFPSVGVGLPYMFTEHVDGALDWVIPGVLLASGLLLNLTLTGRGPLVAAWLAGFAAQAVVRGLVTDVDVIAALTPMTGAAFLLFTNYMITDPGTSPARPRNQVIFGLVAAAVYGLITAAHLVYGLFFCVIATCALRGVVLWALELRSRRMREPEPAVAPVRALEPAA
jgi:enediyne biosynthesis protein E5